MSISANARRPASRSIFHSSANTAAPRYWICIAGLYIGIGAYWFFSSPNGHGAHSAPVSIAEATAQMLIVFMLAMAWDSSFEYQYARHNAKRMDGSGHSPQETADRPVPQFTPWLHPALLTLPPAVLYTMLMREQYNPSVFVMALLAIFVAVEHLQSLKGVHDEMKELTPRKLRAWRDDIYAKYSKAVSRIDVVLREFDMDAHDSSDDGETWSLRKVLTYSENGLARSDSVQFVCDVSELLYRPTAMRQGGSAEFFEIFLGIVWRCSVLHKVRIDRKSSDSNPRSPDNTGSSIRPPNYRLPPKPYVRMRIASSAVWMHAVDNEVIEIYQNSILKESAVKLATEELSKSPYMQRRFSDWAHDEVRRCARRGSDAEEYVCAVLRFAAMSVLSEDTILNRKMVKVILDQIGMEEWIAARDKGRESTSDFSESQCVDCVVQFIEQRMPLYRVYPPYYVSSLLEELM